MEMMAVRWRAPEGGAGAGGSGPKVLFPFPLGWIRLTSSLLLEFNEHVVFRENA